MLRISDRNKLTDYITDQGFGRVTVKTMDETQVMNVVHANAKELAEGLNGWLDRFNGTYILHFRKSENSPHYFGVKWEPDQTASGAMLNGAPGDYGQIKAQILNELRQEQEQKEQKDELDRLKTINGQITTALEAIFPAILQRIMPQQMAAPGANLQGVTIDEMPGEAQEIAIKATEKLLQHVSPVFLMALADHVAANPGVIPMVAQWIGFTEQNQHNESDT